MPTVTGSNSTNGLIIGDGTTATANLTITTATNNSRFPIGSGGIVINPNAGTLTVGVTASQGIELGANQSWTNNSSSLLTVYSVTNTAINPAI